MSTEKRRLPPLRDPNVPDWLKVLLCVALACWLAGSTTTVLDDFDVVGVSRGVGQVTSVMGLAGVLTFGSGLIWIAVVRRRRDAEASASRGVPDHLDA